MTCLGERKLADAMDEGGTERRGKRVGLREGNEKGLGSLVRKGRSRGER